MVRRPADFFMFLFSNYPLTLRHLAPLALRKRFFEDGKMRRASQDLGSVDAKPADKGS